jgi:hypothetical protein
VTCDDPVDVPVPGQPYSFGTLKLAQARADIEALRAGGRRVLRLHVGTDVVSGLGKIMDSIEAVAERRQ